MKQPVFRVSIFSFFLSLTCLIYAQPYPDQHYVLKIDSIYYNIEANQGIKLSDDSTILC